MNNTILFFFSSSQGFYSESILSSSGFKKSLNLASPYKDCLFLFNWNQPLQDLYVALVFMRHLTPCNLALLKREANWLDAYKVFLQQSSYEKVLVRLPFFKFFSLTRTHVLPWIRNVFSYILLYIFNSIFNFIK